MGRQTTTEPGSEPVIETKKKNAAPAKIDFNGSGFDNITETQLGIWSNAYPAITISTELAKAAAWLDANPKNVKSDYRRFLNGWLSRAQNSAPRADAAPAYRQHAAKPSRHQLKPASEFAALVKEDGSVDF